MHVGGRVVRLSGTQEDGDRHSLNWEGMVKGWQVKRGDDILQSGLDGERMYCIYEDCLVMACDVS